MANTAAAPEQLNLPGVETVEQPLAVPNATDEQMQAWHAAASELGHMGTLTVSMMHEHELISYIGQLLEIIAVQEGAIDGMRKVDSVQEPLMDLPVQNAEKRTSPSAELLKLREVLNYIPDNKLARAIELFNEVQGVV